MAHSEAARPQDSRLLLEAKSDEEAEVGALALDDHGDALKDVSGGARDDDDGAHLLVLLAIENRTAPLAKHTPPILGGGVNVRHTGADLDDCRIATAPRKIAAATRVALQSKAAAESLDDDDSGRDDDRKPVVPADQDIVLLVHLTESDVLLSSHVAGTGVYAELQMSEVCPSQTNHQADLHAQEGRMDSTVAAEADRHDALHAALRDVHRQRDQRILGLEDRSKVSKPLSAEGSDWGDTVRTVPRVAQA